MSKEKDTNKEQEQLKDSQTEPNNNNAAEDNKESSQPQEQEQTEDKDPLEAAQEQIADLKDKYLRSVAEFDNYRKRTMKEKTELLLNGAEKSVAAILPVMDDMERALANAEKSDDVEALREGMKLIFQKFEKCLTALGVSKIETKDADFNTDYHEAVAMVPGMGEEKKGKVLDCVQTGYTLNDKVIRHAKVAVGQ